jgi:hypothetical protein
VDGAVDGVGEEDVPPFDIPQLASRRARTDAAKTPLDEMCGSRGFIRSSQRPAIAACVHHASFPMRGR